MGLAGVVVSMGVLVFLWAIGIFAIAISILFFIYRIPKVGKYLSFLLALVMFYILYMSFLPNKKFFIDAFKTKTNITLPSPYFVKKEKSCPKLLGDCHYAAIVLIETDAYKNFREKIKLKKLDSCTTPKIVTQQTYLIPTPLECWKGETKSSESFELIVFPDSRPMYNNLYFTFR